MKIGVIGTRGFPEIQGGVETHCHELYTRLSAFDDTKIVVYRRKPYITEKNKNSDNKNIRFVDFRVPKSMYFETFLHSFYSAIHALFQNYDIIHIHNIGPGFFIPILKLSGAKIVLTYHSISYQHLKWNYVAKQFLHLSEKISLPHSDFVIFISKVIEAEMVKKYGFKNHKYISNGVNIPEKSKGTDFLESLGLESNKYIIAVGRYLEEKGFDYLIRAFRKYDQQEYKLVIVGDSDYVTPYSKRFKAFAQENGVVLTGFIKGEKLNQIFSHAKLFVMSSFSEGLPIALLEAMSYNLDVLVSDIPANLQIGLNDTDYFKVGDEDDLARKLKHKLTGERQYNYQEILLKNFNWEKIAAETYDIYRDLLEKR
ncbi:MAG: glycosyltransferase family 4 protein [Bacteroidales bacterium]|jgi:glycosyltransferase involved in cell wall biosynthesis|nr:glycosyltransferase family 4 protein [Bacteroidales bacterium]